MPEATSARRVDRSESDGVPSRDAVAERVRHARRGLTELLREAEDARRRRAEVGAAGEGAGAVCAWNHFENIPTFYNWNNRPR
ncbi:multiple cyclophane-containing RiPP AmcA [Micromonospora sp. NPDC049559]|uniref:multiple cyclophane-containing RiPP AmcA n=1 Tax=Micromonospora sp. NPDC049559 TaxID=3155923 RepID=UPI0034232F40